MPYKSDAQRRFLHARHPEIAARWDAEIHAKKKKGKVSKMSARTDGWLKPVLAGTVAGGLANQFPRVQDIEREHRRKKKKGQIKKMLLPVSNDPFFNQEAAQKTFDLVMKMDDDTAEVFCFVVASDLLEREVEQNRVTLQKHLDEVILKRLTDTKRAMARAVSKGLEDPVPYAQALALIDRQISKVSHREDDDIPNFEFERKIKRDIATGRFQAKFHNKPIGKKPIPDKTAEAMGIAGTDDDRYKRLGPRDKARYQAQYQQVADFLGAVNAATDGNNQVRLHFKNDRTGETWADVHGSTRPPTSSMLAANTRVIGAEALPTTLTAGGAAFSLAGAMGRQMPESQVRGLNTAAGSSQDWTNTWLQAGNDEAQNSNRRLYARTQTLGTAASAMGAPGGKVQLAGALAEIVGQYGPQAESVLGPSARKTAYRYRGTEKAPDKRLLDMYGQAVNENKRLGPIDPWAERDENRLRRARGAGKQPFGTETGVRPTGQVRPKAVAPKTPSLQQMVSEREARNARSPEWQERELGRQAVSQYLTEKLPSKRNYKLQLASGTTPPSEGVIINADGQIASQAVGYGDDHYLPFNLKNLKELKGGEYVRNRSVGGLTAEDVYTGLISGARRVTVVSRSGTFTMEFQPDFRGGRRHNDKARRMTRRYEQILDAVQSEQVERQDVPTRWKKMIENEVRGEYGPTASQRLIRSEIDNRIKEFKANPQIDGRDLDRAEASITQMEDREKRGEVSRQDVADYRKEIMTELRDLKEIHFRLNGVGYAAALDSLEEQFPYYIHAAARPKEEHLEEFEQDLGYVEPGRNRPTDAQAGWYGTAARGKSGSEGRGGKFSAAHADYQRGLPGAPAPTREPRALTATTDGGAGASAGGGGVQRSERERARDRAAEALEESKSKERVKSAAVALQQQAKGIRPPGESATPEWWDYDENRMRAYVEDPENLKKFNTYVTGLGDRWGETSASRQFQQYRDASSRVESKDYDKSLATIWPMGTYKFPNEAHEAYRASPEPGAVEGEIRNIDGRDASLKFDQPLSALDSRQLREEFELSKTVAAAAKSAGLTGDEAQDALGSQLKNPAAGYASQFFRTGGAEKHLENIHKMHYLKSKGGGAGGATPGQGGSAGFGGGGTGGATARPSGPPSAPTADTDDLDQKLFKENANGWITAARKLQQAQPADTDALDTFINRMANLTRDSGFDAQNQILDALPGDLQTDIHRIRGAMSG